MCSSAVSEHANPRVDKPAHLVVRAWTWLAVWIAVIAVESFFGSSANTGRFLWPLLHWIWPKIRFLTYFQIHYWLRKLGHLSGYAILALFAFRAWWVTFAARKRGTTGLTWRAMLRGFDLLAAAEAVLLVIAVAALDEWHQSMSPGRGSSIHDVILDTMGGMFSLLVLLNIAEWRRKQSAFSPQHSAVKETV